MSNVITVTSANFEADILGASLPVLIDFWADWCGPCQSLAPVLEKIAEDYAGRLIVAKINVDEEQQLAAAAGVRSLPTLLLVRNGQPLDQIIGAQPDANIRAVIDRHVDAAPPEPDDDRSLPGEADQLRAMLADDSDNSAARIALARIEIVEGRLDAAAELLDALSGDDAETADARQARAALDFARAAAALDRDTTALEAAHTGDTGAADVTADLAVARVADGNHDAAAELYLELLRRHRQWGDDHARKWLIRLLDLLGPTDPRTAELRRRMMSALY